MWVLLSSQICLFSHSMVTVSFLYVLLRLLQVLLSPFSPNNIQQSLFHRKGEQVFSFEFRRTQSSWWNQEFVYSSGMISFIWHSVFSFISVPLFHTRFFFLCLVSHAAFCILFLLFQVMIKEAVSPSCASSMCHQLRCPISCCKAP